MVSKCALVFFALFAFTVATNVKKCKDNPFEGLKNLVDLSQCTKPPCKLKKGTAQGISITFTPEEDTSDLTNFVHADVFGVDLPYPGVDGKSICDKLETKSGEKAGCPVKAGETYVYKDAFDILEIYPKISTTVKWALADSNGKFVICFETPAQIV